MDPRALDPTKLTVPLHATTWELDREEGADVNGLKATNTEPLSEPLV